MTAPPIGRSFQCGWCGDGSRYTKFKNRYREAVYSTQVSEVEGRTSMRAGAAKLSVTEPMADVADEGVNPDAFDRLSVAMPAVALTAALESNHIVYFRHCPVPLPDEPTLHYLRSELPSRLRLKNVTYYPEAERLSGLSADAATRSRVRRVLREHLAAVSSFVCARFPHLSLSAGKCSFRPIQERGRNLRPHASNELVHIDAGAYGATHGDRILRVFVNVNAYEDRVWASKGDFHALLQRHGEAAGLLDGRGTLKPRIHENAADRVYSALIRSLARSGELARLVDSSPYDRIMRRLHNYMKDDDGFKHDLTEYEEIRFPPGSAWMTFTDSVSHASLSGQFALVTTIIVRRSSLLYPQFSPFDALAAHAASRSTPSSG